MNRRDFIKNIAPIAVVPFFSNRLFAAIPQLDRETHALLSQSSISDDRILVVVQMTGGNDGLNMVLPLDQYTNLAAARANILIPDTSALTLGSFPTGLHPAMTGLKNLYDNQKLSVVQNVGYNNFNLSHFRAMDIFASGSDSNQIISSGWLGRYVEYYYPGFPAAYPNANEPDPLAICVGSSVAQALQGFGQNTAQQVPNNFTGSLVQLLGYTNTTVPNTPAGTEVDFIRQQQGFANAYANQIVNAWNAGTNSSTIYPPAPSGNNNLAQQLKIVARLIKGGLRTKIYYATIGSFDTHASQTDTTDHTIGTHANLLKELSDSIYAFQTDLGLLGLGDRVLGMTSTEFGRRIKSNAGVGTDHGTVSPVFLFGNYVNPSVIGANPIIPANTTSSTQLPLQIDYREIYMSVLQNWFCLSPTEATNVLMHNKVALNSVIAPCGTPLPIELMAFRAERVNNQNTLLTWETASEQNSDAFEIERSTDARNFESIGKVAAAGHSHSLLSYTFTDKDLEIGTHQIFYYRLKLVDIDGVFSHSEVKRVVFSIDNLPLEASVFPNPSPDGTCQIYLNQDLPQNALSDIYLQDVFGRVIAETTMHLHTQAQTIDFGHSIPSGSYYLVVKNEEGSSVLRWVVQ